MAYISNLKIPKNKNVTKLSDFPSPVGGVITLEDNVTYRIKGLINIGTNYIVAGVSNTIYGNDKSDDGIICSSTSPAIQVTNKTLSINSITVVSTSSPIFNITNSLLYSTN